MNAAANIGCVIKHIRPLRFLPIVPKYLPVPLKSAARVAPTLISLAATSIALHFCISACLTVNKSCLVMEIQGEIL